MSKINSTIIVLLLTFDTVKFTPASAQIIPDKTLPASSTINNQGSSIIIDGGTQVGRNLYHSFSDFSISTGKTAFFNNSVNIENIITRVTGISSSVIDGTIRTNGNANLFLINSNGILFGKNARLQVGGSFLASTANSLNFSDGIKFSTTIPQNNSLLSINVPLGLEFTTNSSAPIIVQGAGHNQFIIGNQVAASITLLESGQSEGLRLQPGRTFALIGGEVVFDGGLVTVPSGQIAIGAINNGTVKLSNDWNYTGVHEFKNISFNKQSLLDTSGFAQGNISIHGKNVTFTDASLALIANFASPTPGAISVNATDTLNLTGITSFNVQPFLGIRRVNRGIITATIFGQGADIFLSAPKIIAQDSEVVSTLTFGPGRSGNLTVNSSELTEIKSVAINESSGVASVFGTITYGSGNAGDVTISTKKLVIQDGGSLSSFTFGEGQGGKITINASETLKVSGGHSDLVLFAYGTEPVPTFSPSNISSLSISSGDAGNISINTKQLIVENGAAISASGLRTGNSGNVNINSSETVYLSGSGLVNPSLNPSRISSSVGSSDPFVNYIYNLRQPSDALSGNVFIRTGNLILENNAQIGVRNDSTKDAGTLGIVANSASLNNSSITASTRSGEGGNIALNVTKLVLGNSTITTTAGGNGNGGNLTINADTITGFGNSSITANAFRGQGGNVSIKTKGFFFSNDSFVSASSQLGIDGRVELEALYEQLDPAQVEPIQIQADPKITASCQGNPNSGSPSKFVIIGTGSAPRNLDSQISNNNGWSPNVAISVADNDLEKLPNQGILPIVEAQSVVISKSGEIILSASPSKFVGTTEASSDNSCFTAYTSTNKRSQQ
ncbi:filamentous hemagglutinin N-terminal domain-containing protein [Nostoc sp. FACHB-87]|uniref:two-partner secretion domain-containing protein n=1 Tax=Nostocales TaxID=1161 RepID=UPI0016845148|nr:MULTISPECIES: filamentous hemagglutinin N-terminal domain-containing protein [Nostocales]MBD2303477.1 filamentous hemagglutinin N-terminal domain-containing protein [Nostoc sp. FACHB-190]MBD2457328.1 filamentous hemagglutinin N-terminal domain-containing protein [Nostoc sp. FACHB-87]MBD2478397.1 filamentous hemagglutinin N-terminal domain-containing protein [Anabaena sp. FACHB-83]MBD2491219.1 filamentous hemagglutinin N-terminal domain-containing protein [Aulosira sp. FACHB-615]